MSIEAHHNTKPAPGHQQNRENTYQVYNGIFQTTGYRIEINCRRNKSVSWWGYDSASVCHAIPSLILCGTYLVGYQATHARHKPNCGLLRTIRTLVHVPAPKRPEKAYSRTTKWNIGRQQGPPNRKFAWDERYFVRCILVQKAQKPVNYLAKQTSHPCSRFPGLRASS